MSIKKYLQESIQDFNSVSWPTRKQAIRITIIVFVFMIISAFIFGLVDQLFSVGYKTLLSL